MAQHPSVQSADGALTSNRSKQLWIHMFITPLPFCQSTHAIRGPSVVRPTPRNSALFVQPCAARILPGFCPEKPADWHVMACTQKQSRLGSRYFKRETGGRSEGHSGTWTDLGFSALRIASGPNRSIIHEAETLVRFIYIYIYYLYIDLVQII